ncbi:MAG: Spy/CpxP family protein refolding chaperone [Granulosicoccus sp.]|jgi:Spy/CpxP family protein refolding chaperone
MKKIISTLTMALVIASAGFAQQDVKSEQVIHKEKKVVKHRKGGGQIMQIESLSESQRTELQKMRNQNREVSKPQREKVRMVKEEIRTKQSSDSPNMEEINKLIDEKHTLEAQMEKNRAAQGVKMRSVLTPEQKAELDVNMKARKAEHKQMKGERKELKKSESVK